ncbi:MAG TPA: hypothetical protein VFS39_07745, partial [Nitrospira sp.]|nr:hypothetical protein [Nitrospira sp.]
ASTMKLSREVQQFTSCCEHLVAEAEMSGRVLTEDEASLIEYYCRELMTKIVKPPASSGMAPDHRSDAPSSPTLPPDPRLWPFPNLYPKLSSTTRTATGLAFLRSL